MNSLDIFRDDLCDGCGECLQKCPALRLTGREAKAEMARLLAGGVGKRIDGRCCSCFLCDQLCPKGANPHSLILRRWGERLAKRGAPFFMALGAPQEPEPNLWSLARGAYSRRERDITSEWDENFAALRGGDAGGRDFLLMGCNQWLNPLVADTGIFRDLRVAGSREFCCGEPYYRSGMLGRAEGIFERNLSLFGTRWAGRAGPAWRAGRVVVFCPSCFNMLANIYPKLTGRRVAAEMVTLPDWLLERIRDGKIKFTNKLNMKVWVQRNCHAPTLGEDFHDAVLEVLSAAGARAGPAWRAVEGEPGGPGRPGRHWCCGLGPAAARQNPLDMAAQMARHLSRLPARDVACYCNGCLLTMAGVEKAAPLGFRFYHLVDIVRMAAGEKPARYYAGRMARLFATALAAAPAAALKKGLRYYP
ncbi:MAG: (Fe-S)-binding protein [bacterium]